MPPRLPPNLLDRSAPESARLLSLSHLDQVDKIKRRLSDPRDGEALHDFRVGLRRLHSTLSAYRAQLEDSVTPRMRRRVRKLARSTNEGRDLEVQLQWMGKQLDQLKPEEIPGFYWLVGRLEDRKRSDHDHLIAAVGLRYQKTSEKLRRALGVLRVELDTGQGQVLPTFREVTGSLTREHVRRLRQDFSAIRGSSDFEQAHRTRISMKKLRYLLEPIARRNRKAGALVRLFKEGQDLLGEHHDMHILSGAIASLRSGAATSGFAAVESGLLALARLAEAGAASAFDRFQSLWGEETAGWILSRADELAESLEQQSSPPPTPVQPPAPAPAPPEDTIRQLATDSAVDPPGQPEGQTAVPAEPADGRPAIAGEVARR